MALGCCLYLSDEVFQKKKSLATVGRKSHLAKGLHGMVEIWYASVRRRPACSFGLQQQGAPGSLM
jgi:hypothetical protein